MINLDLTKNWWPVVFDLRIASMYPRRGPITPSFAGDFRKLLSSVPPTTYHDIRSEFSECPLKLQPRDQQGKDDRCNHGRIVLPGTQTRKKGALLGVVVCLLGKFRGPTKKYSTPINWWDVSTDCLAIKNDQNEFFEEMENGGGWLLY